MPEKIRTANVSVANRVASAVLQSLRDGEMAPGQRLVEAETARQLGTSRPAVREAFAKLAADGVISFARNRGASVRKFSATEIRDIFQVRANLEGLAARLAASAPGKISGMIEKLHLAALEAAEDGDISAYISCNERFHRSIVEASGNKALAGAIERLGNTIAGVQFHRALTRSSMLTSSKEHARIMKAIKAGNAEAAEAAAITHVEASLDVLEKAMKRKG